MGTRRLAALHLFNAAAAPLMLTRRCHRALLWSWVRSKLTSAACPHAMLRGCCDVFHALELRSLLAAGDCGDRAVKRGPVLPGDEARGRRGGGARLQECGARLARPAGEQRRAVWLPHGRPGGRVSASRGFVVSNIGAGWSEEPSGFPMAILGGGRGLCMRIVQGRAEKGSHLSLDLGVALCGVVVMRHARLETERRSVCCRSLKVLARSDWWASCDGHCMRRVTQGGQQPSSKTGSYKRAGSRLPPDA